MPDIDYEKLEKKVDDAIDKEKGKYLFYFLIVLINPKTIKKPKLLTERWKGIQEFDLNFNSETIKECKYIQKVAEIRSKYYPPWYALSFFLIAQASGLLLIFLKDYLDYLGIFIIVFIVIVGLFVYHKADTLSTICNAIIQNTEKRILSNEKNLEETGIQT